MTAEREKALRQAIGAVRNPASLGDNERRAMLHMVLFQFTLSETEKELMAGDKPASEDARLDLLLRTGWRIWCECDNFIRLKMSIMDVDPAAFWAMMLELTAKDGVYDGRMEKAVQTIAAETKSFVDKVERGFEIVPVDEIHDFQGDPEELLRAYFILIQELGTFHADRDLYDSEEKKRKLDKLVAIMERLSRYDIELPKS